MTISSIPTTSDQLLNQQQMASINEDFSADHRLKTAVKRSSAGFGNKLNDSMELIKLQIRKSQQNELDLENHVDSEEEQQGDDQNDSEEEEDKEKNNDWEEEDDNNNESEEDDLESFFPATNFGHLSVHDRILQQSCDEDDENNAKAKGRKTASPSQDDGFEFVSEDNGDSDSETEPVSADKPFWYGFEEEEQVKRIMQMYHDALSLDEDRKNRIREPPPFIGRIKRLQVENESIFTTLDQATVYSRSVVCPGTEMPIKKTAYLVTTWSSEDGLPLEIEVIDEEEERDWNNDVSEKELPQYIFCLPVYESPSEFKYYVSEQDRHITYSPSKRVTSQVLYQDVIPDSLRYPQSDREDEMMGDSDLRI